MRMMNCQNLRGRNWSRVWSWWWEIRWKGSSREWRQTRGPHYMRIQSKMLLWLTRRRLRAGTGAWVTMGMLPEHWESMHRKKRSHIKKQRDKTRVGTHICFEQIAIFTIFQTISSIHAKFLLNPIPIFNLTQTIPRPISKNTRQLCGTDDWQWANLDWVWLWSEFRKWQCCGWWYFECWWEWSRGWGTSKEVPKTA